MQDQPYFVVLISGYCMGLVRKGYRCSRAMNAQVLCHSRCELYRVLSLGIGRGDVVWRQPSSKL